MSLTPKGVFSLIVFLVLWILWCIFVVSGLTPWIELHLKVWRWLASWILWLLPLIALGFVLAQRVRKNKL